MTDDTARALISAIGRIAILTHAAEEGDEGYLEVTTSDVRMLLDARIDLADKLAAATRTMASLAAQLQEARVIALRDISEPGTGICPTAYQIYLATGGQPLARDVAADTEADLRAARDMLRKHDDRATSAHLSPGHGTEHPGRQADCSAVACQTAHRQHEAAADIQDLTYELFRDETPDA